MFLSVVCIRMCFSYHYYLLVCLVGLSSQWNFVWGFVMVMKIINLTYINVGLSLTELACLWCVKLVNFNVQYVGFVSIPFEELANLCYSWKEKKTERRLIKVTIVPKNVNSSLKGKMLSTSYMNRVKLHAGGLKISSMYSPAFTTKYTL